MAHASGQHRPIRYGTIAEPLPLVTAGRRRQHRGVSDFAGHIHLILPDPIERAACFRALTGGGARVVRSFASGDDWLDAGADTDSAGTILLFHWRQPGRLDGAALLGEIAARPDIIAFVAAVLVADNRYIAEDAANLVEIDFDTYEAVTNIDQALTDKVLVHESAGTNMACKYDVSRGDARASAAFWTPSPRGKATKRSRGSWTSARARSRSTAPTSCGAPARAMSPSCCGCSSSPNRRTPCSDNRVHFGA